MLNDTANDSSRAGDSGPAEGDAHAAILLVESLIHGLVERSVIELQDAVEIVNTAVEVQEQTIREHEFSPAAAARALSALRSIHSSLLIDLPREKE